MSTIFAFGMPGLPEILIVGAVMLLLFGHRLPGIMRSLGQGIVEFKKGVNDIHDDVEDASSKDKKIKDEGSDEDDE